MRHRFSLRALLLALGLALISPGCALWASQQGSDPAAVELVRQAVNAELEANRTDNSIWMYRESDVTNEKNAVYTTIETPQGTLRRLIELNGHPLSPQAVANEKHRINNYVHDSSAQAKARRAGAHDDAQAEELLKMLPEAFLWTKAGESGDYDTLNFRPNPNFDPPDMQSRVMGIMEGEMVISKEGHRIRTLKGQAQRRCPHRLGHSRQAGPRRDLRRRTPDGRRTPLADYRDPRPYRRSRPPLPHHRTAGGRCEDGLEALDRADPAAGRHTAYEYAIVHRPAVSVEGASPRKPNSFQPAFRIPSPCARL